MSRPAVVQSKPAILDHLFVVESIAKQIKKELHLQAELGDLIAYGTQGLMEAAQRYDDRAGISFASFAQYRVRGAIYDGVRQMAQLSRYEYARLRVQTHANEYLQNQSDQYLGLDHEPTSHSAKETLTELHKVFQNLTVSCILSLETLLESGVDFEEPRLDSDDLLDLRRMLAAMRAALVHLPMKERHFIEKHYFEGKTLAQAGAELGLSKSWASRLHSRALHLLHQALERTR